MTPDPLIGCVVLIAVAGGSHWTRRICVHGPWLDDFMWGHGVGYPPDADPCVFARGDILDVIWNPRQGGVV